MCEPECPVDAIQSDTDPGADEWLEYNKEMSEIWPNITMKIDPLPHAEKYADEEGKYMKEKTSELFGFIFPNIKPSESCNY